MSENTAADDADGFAVPRQVLSLLDGFGKPWWVAGGWAVDLFIGRLTRPHKDIEIAVFRRDPTITRPAKLIAARSADGVPFLRPEIVLLYKSRDAGPNDHADFDRAAPLLDPDSRAWLATALRRHVPGHRWLHDL